MRVARVVWVGGGAALAFALGACHREPTFDERYARARAALGSEAAGIDAELAARDSEAAAADAVLGRASPSPSLRPSDGQAHAQD